MTDMDIVRRLIMEAVYAHAFTPLNDDLEDLCSTAAGEIKRLRAAVDDLTAENTALRQMLDGFMQAQAGGEE